MKIYEELQIHDTLNPALWDDMELKPDVKTQLIKIVSKYIAESEVIKIEDIIDIELLGSNAGYNYIEHSDIDLHIVVNMESISCDPALVQIACNAERSTFNKNYDIKVKSFDVELYVEDVKAGTASNGIYSLTQDKWIKTPERKIIPDYSQDPEYIELLNYYKNLANEKMTASSSFDIQQYINDLYNLRRISIMTDGEYAKGNFVFKEIRNAGLLDGLKDRMKELTSRELSLEKLKNRK